MIKFLLVIVFLVFGCAMPPAQSPAVVLLNDRLAPSCGAVAVTPRTLVTAAHCVEGQTEKWYVTDAEWRYRVSTALRAKVIRSVASRDLAWLRIDDKDPALPSVLRRQPILGERAYAVAPYYDWAVSVGAVQAQTMGFLWSSVSIEPGWSGSPVFGMDGKLIAVVSACMGGSELAGLKVVKWCSPGFSFLSAFGPISDGAASADLRLYDTADGRALGGAPASE